MTDFGPFPSYAVYLAGPMSNLPAFNFPQFFDAAAALREELGWTVLSPAEKDLERIPLAEMELVPGYDTGDLPLYVANSSFTMANAMEWDLPAIMAANGIVLLDGWETSTGARWERIVAEALGRDIWLLKQHQGTAEWTVVQDREPTQLSDYLRGFPTRGERIVVAGTDLRSLAGEFAGALVEQANELSDNDLDDMADEFVSNVLDVAAK